LADESRPNSWGLSDAIETYGIDSWGGSFVSVTEKGRLAIGPQGAAGPRIDLKELVDGLVERGIDLPLLIRFPDLLKGRLEEIHQVFAMAMAECGYGGSYRGVYPIKVNQNRFMVQELIRYGRPYHFGMEAGSKPELLAVMALLSDPESLIICNGYKDQEYVEMALLASRLGPKIFLVVEKPAELALIVELAQKVGVRPNIGIRARLSARGAGRWEASAGERSKFGLSSREILQAVSYLGEKGMLDCLLLLHFHLGSQISSIRNIKDGLREAGRLYVELARIGAPLGYLDVGGGLGVDYVGVQANSPSSMNYTLQEYANDVVAGVMEVCDPAEIPHPVLVTEAGRATVAQHAVLVTEVLGVRSYTEAAPLTEVPEGAEAPLEHLVQTYLDLTAEDFREAFHDALQYRDECLSLFNLGHLSLQHRVLAEDVFVAICLRCRDLVRGMEEMPEELKRLEKEMADTYFCNFSLFQSLPDSWAIGQLFPLLPIHRLNEEPTRRAVLADMTCDSDGKIESFIGGRVPKEVLELHPLRGEPYYLGAFLVGAYQEILGDLHNLFGDTNTVHAVLDEQAGGYRIEHVVEGDTVREVLRYVEYDVDDLVARLRQVVETAIRHGRINRQEARHLLRSYQSGLAGYTYLERG
jgi:arginine decarboxylase